MICEQCGNEMEYFVEGSTCGAKCENCGCDWEQPIKFDTTDYQLYIEPINNPNVNNLRCISSLFGCNFLETKNKLNERIIFTTKGNPHGLLFVAFINSLPMPLVMLLFNIIPGDRIPEPVFFDFNFSGLNQPAYLIVCKVKKYSCFLQSKCYLCFVHFETRFHGFLLLSLYRHNFLR